jgi:hypothetical protein
MEASQPARVKEILYYWRLHAQPSSMDVSMASIDRPSGTVLPDWSATVVKVLVRSSTTICLEKNLDLDYSILFQSSKPLNIKIPHPSSSCLVYTST